MSETTAEQPQASQDDGLPDAPKDAPEDTATGYALYDRTIGQYVGPVLHQKAKPSRDKFPDTPKGHRVSVVRV